MKAGFKLVNMEKKYYIYLLKPLVAGLIPGFLMRKIKSKHYR